MKAIDWFSVFQEVSTRGNEALQWRLPEPWVHAELFAVLNRKAKSTGWLPFSIEIPYVTFYPVTIPRKGHSDWKEHGGVKYVDLCIHNQVERSWCWFEFKVRHAGKPPRREQASKEAQTAFCRDVVALLGFDTERTGAIWATPDQYTKAYWMLEELLPHARDLAADNHFFISAFLLLDGVLDTNAWKQETVMKSIQSWLNTRQIVSSSKMELPTIDISNIKLQEGHELLLCEWNSPG